MKPTFDLISRDGAFPLSGTLDHVGPITANVSDNALMLEVLAGSGSKYRRLIGKSIAGLKVGVPNAFYCEYLALEVRRCLIDASEAFRQAGATVVVVDVPRIYDIYRAQQLIIRTEAYALHEQAIKEGRPFSEEVLTRLKSGADVTAAQYLSALRERDVARAAFDAVLEDVDVLLTATCGITAPLLEERTTKILGEAHPTFWVLTRLTAPTNLSGHPSLSVPFGVVDHLPIGMQLIGRYDEEATLYQLASHLERAHSHSI
jgi:aspartyl-tRNA(Asn)/glutamyl-tRNA(Gln) amidotransferase subunit A